ncbi:MAG: hypothetical protein IT173_07925 [Acidobacteria bacterium]|nr:hypothetical protein [Acidobacteriota bacterium]
MKELIGIVVLFLMSASAFGQPTQSKAGPPSPTGWGKTGTEPKNYEMHLDTSVKRSGNSSAVIRSTASVTKDGFAAFIQSIKPDEFRGKRLRLSGYLKSEGVADWGGLWLRIDAADPSIMLEFDNMENRPVKGTSDWKKYEIVLDVPSEAAEIVYGFLLSGKGQVWADDIQLEEVGKDAVKTGSPIDPKHLKEAEEFKRKDPAAHERFNKKALEARAKRPMKPVNLGFEN